MQNASAGAYRTKAGFVVQRAWCCAHCHVTWYDYRDCPRCHKDGKPEMLPVDAVIVYGPDLQKTTTET